MIGSLKYGGLAVALIALGACAQQRQADVVPSTNPIFDAPTSGPVSAPFTLPVPAGVPAGPVTASQVTVGESGGFALDNATVVSVAGLQYSVGFLKAQLSRWSAGLPGDTVFTQQFIEREYGFGSGALLAFESFIASNFPNGQPIPVEPDGGIGDGAGPIIAVPGDGPVYEPIDAPVVYDAPPAEVIYDSAPAEIIYQDAPAEALYDPSPAIYDPAPTEVIYQEAPAPITYEAPAEPVVFEQPSAPVVYDNVPTYEAAPAVSDQSGTVIYVPDGAPLPNGDVSLDPAFWEGFGG